MARHEILERQAMIGRGFEQVLYRLRGNRNRGAVPGESHPAPGLDERVGRSQSGIGDDGLPSMHVLPTSHAPSQGVKSHSRGFILPFGQMNPYERLQHDWRRSLLCEQFIRVLLRGVQAAQVQVQLEQFDVLHASRHVVEVYEQRVDVTLREGAQPAAETPLVRQCPVDVEDAGSSESMLALHHPVGQGQDPIPVPTLSMVMQRPFVVCVRSRECQAQDRRHGHREQTQDDSRMGVCLWPGNSLGLADRCRGSLGMHTSLFGLQEGLAQERHQNQARHERMQNERKPVGQGGELEGLAWVPRRSGCVDGLRTQAKNERAQDKSPAGCEDCLRGCQTESPMQQGFGQTSNAGKHEGRSARQVIGEAEQNQERPCPPGGGPRGECVIEDRSPDRQSHTQQCPKGILVIVVVDREGQQQGDPGQIPEFLRPPELQETPDPQKDRAQDDGDHQCARQRMGVALRQEGVQDADRSAGGAERCTEKGAIHKDDRIGSEDAKSIVQQVGFDPFPQVDEKPEKNDCRQADFQPATIVDTPRSCFLDLQALSTSVPNLLFPGGSADSHICPTLRV